VERYSLKQNIPAISIGKAKREDLNASNPFPGPGTYNHKKDTKNPPKYSFGTGKREHSKTVYGPGPGKLIFIMLIILIISFNRRKKLISVVGFYEFDGNFSMNEKEGKGPSMKGKWKSQLQKNNPGPGAYQESDKFTKSNAPGWKIGTD
jgi:Sperm-tail PG-rich repeat